VSVQVLNKSREQRGRMLQTVARNVNAWSVKTCKLKAVYLVMNMFQNEGQNYVAEGWLPYAELGTVQAVLNRASVSSTILRTNFCHRTTFQTIICFIHATIKITICKASFTLIIRYHYDQ
jgi:vacuolar-type H+-ATPase subunit I/STV1